MRFIEYFCDKRDLFGVIACCKMPNIRPRWMRLGAFVGAQLPTISLAFIFGTFLYNREDCSYFQDTCDGVPMAVTCTDADNYAYYEAYLATMLLSLAVSEGSALAVNSVKTGSLRQKLQLAATLLTAAGLVIYGVLYASSWSKGDIGDDYDGDSRRYWYIELVLLVGWGVAEVAGIGLVLWRFLMCRIFYYLVYRSRLEEEKKSVGAAAIYPQTDRKLDDASIESGIDASNNPKTMIEATDRQNPTSVPEDDVAPDSANSSTTMIEPAARQKPTSIPDDATPGSANSPKTTIEDVQKVVRAPDVAPGSANSPKAKIGDGEEKPSFRFAGDKSMSARVDRQKVLTENIKLEPPKRGEHQ